MKRDPASLADRSFDLVVIGGGIFGACAVLDAAQRGLNVALIERGDLCGATSAHSYKMIHGGIRYLQHADVIRVRKSAAARRSFLKIAPHLCHPLPIVIPTYGQFGMKGKTLLRAGMAAYDALTMDRNRDIDDPTRHIPNGWTLSLDEVKRRYPGLDQDGLSGAGVFCDGQMYNPPRIVMAMARAAHDLGATIANYTEATGLITRQGKIEALTVRDNVSGNAFDVRTSMVLNAAGPYVERLLTGMGPYKPERTTPFSRDTYFIVNRPLIEGDHALTVPSRTGDPDAFVSRGARHLFLVPWHGATLVGVWHHVYPEHPDDFVVTEDQLQSYLDEINEAYGGLDLTLDDVSLVNAGLVPFGENDPGASDLKFAHRSRLIDHGKEHDLKGLVSLIGVRYTTGPLDAPKAIDLLAKSTGRKLPASNLTERPVHGADFDRLCALEQAAKDSAPAAFSETSLKALVRNHGSDFDGVFDVMRQNKSPARTVAGSDVLAGEVAHAVNHEMAITLADVLFRRTDLATAAPPSAKTLIDTANLMATAAGWDDERRQSEIDQIEGRIASRLKGRMSLCDRPQAIFDASKGVDQAVA